MGSAIQPSPAAQCPACDYDLTGLPQPRCPECGTAFDWETVRAAAAQRPTLAFEQARGRRRVRGFVVTWLTVLFAPWIFARQVARRASFRDGLIFASICFLSTGSAFFTTTMAFGGYMDMVVWVTWLLTAAACIVIEAVLLTLAELSHRQAWSANLRFWMTVGLYASAVMPTEVLGPPMLGWSTLWWGAVAALSDWNSLIVSIRSEPLAWTLTPLYLLAWLAPIGCCYYQRMRRRRFKAATAIAASLLVMMGLTLLYAPLVEYFGAELVYDLVEDLI